MEGRLGGRKAYEAPARQVLVPPRFRLVADATALTIAGRLRFAVHARRVGALILAGVSRGH